MSKRMCLVLGGSGFLGQNLVARLLEQEYPVRVLSRRAQTSVEWAANLGTRIEWFVGDFNETLTVERSLEGVGAVFHLVSSTLPARPNIDAEREVVLNISSSAVLLELCRRMNVRKVVFFSSGGTVYGFPNSIPIAEDHPCEPISSYGIQKLAIEKYLGLYHHLYGLEVISLRIANPYGPGQRRMSMQGFIGVSLNAITHGLEVEIWGDGLVVRDYIHVDDVTRAALLALKSRLGAEVINIGSGVGTSLLDVLLELERATGCKARIRYQPGRPFDVPINVLCIAKAEKILGWRPEMDLRRGIEHLVQKYQLDLR
jgi:UDP-glucose 4-epimerase